LLFCTQLLLSFVKQKPDITYSTFFFSHNIFFWNCDDSGGYLLTYMYEKCYHNQYFSKKVVIWSLKIGVRRCSKCRI
jgi:hypothetical protein